MRSSSSDPPRGSARGDSRCTPVVQDEPIQALLLHRLHEPLRVGASRVVVGDLQLISVGTGSRPAKPCWTAPEQGEERRRLRLGPRCAGEREGLPVRPRRARLFEARPKGATVHGQSRQRRETGDPPQPPTPTPRGRRRPGGRQKRRHRQGASAVEVFVLLRPGGNSVQQMNGFPPDGRAGLPAAMAALRC
jgi:hypothetical protein